MPDCESVDALAAQVRRAGFAFAEGAAVDAILGAAGGLDDWDVFAESWDHLDPDQYLAATGRYRRRRHAVFDLGAALDSSAAPHRLPDQPHFQTLAHNPLQGGLARWFTPMTDTAVGTRAFQALMGFGRKVFARLDSAAATGSWRVEAHQFRIEAKPDHAGEPTPEGMHRDGVDYVLVVLVERRNIERGTTSIHAPDGAELGSFTLTRPRDIALVDDNRVFHGVTAVTPRDPSRLAHRDVLVLTYCRGT